MPQSPGRPDLLSIGICPGLKLSWVDCDGNIEALLPLWVEGGVRGFYPLEVAAGMDAGRQWKQMSQQVIDLHTRLWVPNEHLPRRQRFCLKSQPRIVGGCAHHRISVARAVGERYIEAQATVWQVRLQPSYANLSPSAKQQQSPSTLYPDSGAPSQYSPER